MEELGSLGWWKARSERVIGPGHRLARAMHSSYHRLLSYPFRSSSCPLSDYDGRLSEIAVSYLEMMTAVKGAKLWLRNDFEHRDHAHVYAAIAQRLPEAWAKSKKRCYFALTAFQSLCENKDWDERPAGQRLSQRLSRSTYTIFYRDRFDFFLFVAALAFDDDAWAAAMQEGEEA